MTKYTINDTTLTAIADNIREGTGQSGIIEPENMPFALSEMDTTGYGKVPSYWSSAVDTVVSTINGIKAADNNNIPLFAWFADVHKSPNSTSPNAGYTGVLAAAVMNRCNVPYAMLCGDAMASGGNGFTSESQVIDNFIEINRMFAPIGWHRLLQTQGNHDGSWGTVDGTAYAYQSTQEKINKWIYRKMTTANNHKFGGDGSYYYVDDTVNKIRIIMLNSLWSGSTVDYPNFREYSRQHYWGYGQTQLDWLCSTVLNVADGWLVAIGTHIPPTSSYKSNTREYDIIRGILSAYENKTSYSGSYTKNSSRGEGDWANVSINVNFSTAKGKIIGFFAGHCHRDQIITDDLPFPIVTIRTDCYTTSMNYGTTAETNGRAKNTNTEHCIDFITVNRAEETVTLTRLGAGDSRVYSYAQKVVYSISNVLTNVTSNNNTVAVTGGESYTAILSVNDGYDMKSVIITMGGVDITSSVYSNGVINITSVTGNVVIKAVATEPEPEIVNKMVVQSNNINKRISGTNVTSYSTYNGAFVCDPIAVDLTKPCPVVFKNFASGLESVRPEGVTAYNNSKVALLDANKNCLAVWYIACDDKNNSMWKCVVDGDDCKGDLTTILNSTPTAGTAPSDLSSVGYVIFSPQISSSALTIASLNGLEILMY